MFNFTLTKEEEFAILLQQLVEIVKAEDRWSIVKFKYEEKKPELRNLLDKDFNKFLKMVGVLHSNAGPFIQSFFLDGTKEGEKALIELIDSAEKAEKVWKLLSEDGDQYGRNFIKKYIDLCVRYEGVDWEKIFGVAEKLLHNPKIKQQVENQEPSEKEQNQSHSKPLNDNSFTKQDELFLSKLLESLGDKPMEKALEGALFTPQIVGSKVSDLHMDQKHQNPEPANNAFFTGLPKLSFDNNEPVPETKKTPPQVEQKSQNKLIPAPTKLNVDTANLNQNPLNSGIVNNNLFTEQNENEMNKLLKTVEVDEVLTKARNCFDKLDCKFSKNGTVTLTFLDAEQADKFKKKVMSGKCAGVGRTVMMRINDINLEELHEKLDQLLSQRQHGKKF